MDEYMAGYTGRQQQMQDGNYRRYRRGEDECLQRSGRLRPILAPNR
jgi:hypothetical protein